MARFEHQRHKLPSELTSERELVLVCPALKSRVNLSRIIRLAGCFGIQRVIACRPFSLDTDITRDALEWVEVESRGAFGNKLPATCTEPRSKTSFFLKAFS